MKARTAILIGLALLLTPLFHLEAQIPGTLSYQAFLSDSLGVPKADGTYTITFSLYDVETGGTALWTETKDDLDVKQGLFYTHLGPFPSSLRFDQPYWLGIQVGSESELAPRIPLTSVGYSFMALRSDSAQYAVLADSARYTTHALLADSAQHAVRADTAKVAASALAAADLADDAVTTAKILDGTVATDDLADNAVTSSKITDGTIRREDVLPDFTAPYADTSDYADTSYYALSGPPSGSAGGDLTGSMYPNPTIAPNAVNSEKILDGTVTGSDISMSAVVNIASLNLSGDAAVGGSLTASALDVTGTAHIGGQFTTYGGHIMTLTTKTTAYTANTSDRIILCNPVDSMTVSLPAAADAEGLVLIIKNMSWADVYLDPAGSELIDGSTSRTIWGRVAASIVSDGSAWWIISWVPGMD